MNFDACQTEGMFITYKMNEPKLRSFVVSNFLLGERNEPAMSQKCRIQSQVTLANDTIKQLKKRILVMEEELEIRDIPEEKRAGIETEIAEIKKLLDKNEEILSKLHKENSKTFAFAVLIMFLCFLVYGIYVMMYNIPK